MTRLSFMFHVTKGGSTHLVNVKKVCRNAFLAVFAWDFKEKIPAVLKEYLRGSIKALRMPTSRTITAKTADAEAWLAKYFESISDIECHTTVSYTYRIFYPKETFTTS